MTESMGEIYLRTQEHLGQTDAAVIRMRRMLLKAAKDLANGIEPPAHRPVAAVHEHPVGGEDPGAGRGLAGVGDGAGPVAAAGRGEGVEVKFVPKRDLPVSS